MNKVAKAVMKYKSRMWHRYRESRTFNDLVEYRRAQNKAVKEYKKAKIEFEKKLAKRILKLIQKVSTLVFDQKRK